MDINKKIVSREDLLLKKLLHFYSTPDYLKIFIKIVEQGTSISLRLLDFFSTSYSKHNRVYINLVDVHTDYKNRLSSYKKSCFDPFCRSQRIFVTCKNGNIREDSKRYDLDYVYIDDISKYIKRTDGIITTVGQLNFFQWCIEKNIFGYIIKNIENIHKYMEEVSSLKTTKNNSTTTTITNQNSNVHKTSIGMTITFG
jgi:hypothetical protein